MESPLQQSRTGLGMDVFPDNETPRYGLPPQNESGCHEKGECPRGKRFATSRHNASAVCEDGSNNEAKTRSFRCFLFLRFLSLSSQNDTTTTVRCIGGWKFKATTTTTTSTTTTATAAAATTPPPPPTTTTVAKNDAFRTTIITHTYNANGVAAVGRVVGMDRWQQQSQRHD